MEQENGNSPTFRGLFISGDRSVSIKEEPLPPLGDNQVRIRTEFASIKHGTDFHVYSGESPYEKERYDSRLHLWVPRHDVDNSPDAPAFAAGYVGNTGIGVVTEVGAVVKTYRPGDRVYGYAPVCDVLTRAEGDVHPLRPPLTETDAVCLDPGLVAYAAVRDAHVCLGDNVAVFGLGAIGLLTVQMLRRAGCLNIIAVDPVQKRRELAREYGADLALDPTAAGCDIALEVRCFLGQGADIAIEASGNYRALREALRSVQKCARVVTLGFYKGKDTELELGKEWMHNRLDLISSLPAWNNPPREYPVWTEKRLVATVEELFWRKLLQSAEILDPIVDFADSPAAYQEAYRDPSRCIKLGIRFPG